jgi:hypothetical protein
MPTPHTYPRSSAGDGARSRARADLIWYLRHADALARWPVLTEPWAQRIERHRLDPDADQPHRPDGGA